MAGGQRSAGNAEILFAALPAAAKSAVRAASLVPNKKVQLKSLDYLQPEHATVQGVSKETALVFGAGFSPAGLYGPFAIPVHDTPARS